VSRARAVPAVLLLPAAAAVAFFLLPLAGLCWRMPWSQVIAKAAGPEILGALSLSLECSVAATLLSLLLGLPLATWLAGGSSRLHAAIRVLVTLPMVLPPVVGGVALLLAYGRHGLVGGPVERWLGLVLPFSVEGVVVAEAYVAMPFFVLTVEGGVRSLDQRYAAAAATLGAGPWRVFRTVTVPLLLPSLRAGLLVAWARALGEFGATITFAGNLQGRTQTLPLAVFERLQTDPEAAFAISMLLIAIAFAVIVGLRGRFLR
jgi:molybdate transport system permease protein